MTTQKFLEKISGTKRRVLGKSPVVVLPLPVWREVENKLEDLEMLKSEKLALEIARARREKKMYSAGQVKKILGIS